MRRVLLAVLILASCGRTVGRSDGRPANRIVSLLPSFTEILFAIGAGDRLVGRTTWCDYPPAALAVASVGDGMPPNIEAVAARKPDLVVLYNSGPNATAAQQLDGLGIRTVLLDMNRLEDLAPAARTLGRLTGLEQRADSLATAMDSLTSPALARPRPPSTASLAFVVWDNPPIIIGRGSYLDQLATLAGARNVFDDVATPSSQVSLETIAARDPQWIAVLTDSAVTPAFAKRPEWRAVRAVREGRFLLLRGSLFGRPGPRSGQAVKELRALLGQNGVGAQHAAPLPTGSNR